jgi:PAS domain S-box-containing protein
MAEASLQSIRSVNRLSRPTRQELGKEIVALRCEVDALRREKQNLELLLEVTTLHSDAVTENLHLEKEDLAVLLEMNTEHADAVEEELHQRAAEALRESERRLRMIVQATPVPVLISRLRDGAIVYANSMSGPLLGLATDALLERPIGSFYQEPADYARLLLSFAQEREIDGFEAPLRRADDVTVWAELSLRPLDFGNEPSVLCAIHDNTERIASARQLKALNDELAERNSLLARLGVDIAHGARTPLLNATDVSELVPELIEVEGYDVIRALSEALGE